MHVVLKAFRCSFDGVSASMLEVGKEYEFGSMAEGLKKVGLIGDAAPASVTESTNSAPADVPSPVPSDPIDLDAMKRAELDAYAASLGLDTTEAANKAEAKEAIEAELARRAADAELGTETDPTA